MARLAAYGIELELPRGWYGRIYRRRGAAPTLHAGNFELPADDADFGSGALGRMPGGGMFIALKEYQTGPELRPGRGLYAPHSIPLPLQTRYFNPHALQVGRPGQAGYQHFFTAAGKRTFCLYAVLRGGAVAAPEHSEAQVRRLSGVLSSLKIEARQ